MQRLDINNLIEFSDRKFNPVVPANGIDMRVVLLCLRVGQRVPEHSAAGGITAQAVTGCVTFYEGDEACEMSAGTLVRLDAGRAHRVKSHTDAALLVTMVKTPRAARRDDVPASEGRGTRPRLIKRMRPHLNMSGTSYRLDETYLKVGTEWKYLYRAVDSTGQTIELMLSAKRDVSAAKRFFKKLMRADHRRLPFTIGTDKHASYPQAFAASVKEKMLPFDCKLRRVKYLDNLIEQDDRAIRRRWRAALVLAARSTQPSGP